MQNTGDLVLTANSVETWHSNSAGTVGTYNMTVTNLGKITVSNSVGTVVWTNN